MKIKSVELRDYCSLDPSLRTMNLLEESHDLELEPSGWVKWRKKGGEWKLCPPGMIRNIGLMEDVSTTEVSQDSPEPALKKRGRPAKQ